jgi:hypothetical protein
MINSKSKNHLTLDFQTMYFSHFLIHFEQLKNLWINQLKLYEIFLNFIHNKTMYKDYEFQNSNCLIKFIVKHLALSFLEGIPWSFLSKFGNLFYLVDI